MDDTLSFFVQNKPVLAITTIYRKEMKTECYVSTVSKSIDTTYAHTSKMISELENHGLVKAEKNGRKKDLYLTDRGRMYAETFLELIDACEDPNYAFS